MRRHVNGGFENLRPRVDQLEAELADAHRALAENSRTIVFLAQQLGKALAQRDRARDTACRFEAELANERAIHS